MTSLTGSRWQGAPGRLEVWYTTLQDAATGTGLWLHHELLAPPDGSGARAHGWAAVFAPGRAPLLSRFGPRDWRGDTDGFRAGEVTWTDRIHSGRAGDLAWDLTRRPGGVPLHPFPRRAWGSRHFPGAQVVVDPAARYSGTVRVGDRVLDLTEAPGADARIRARSNPQRWGWLHAPLGDGDVCEVVTAVPRGLPRVPPLTVLRCRLAGTDWPRAALLGVAGLRARLGRDGWEVAGRVGARTVRIAVRLPEVETAEVGYVDPDGARLLCRTSLLADARVQLSRRGRVERSWTMLGTAHAEVGGFRTPGAGLP